MRLLILVAISVSGAFAQTVDNSDAAKTIPYKVRDAEPGRCVQGEMYLNSTTNALRLCTATNKWEDIRTPSGMLDAKMVGVKCDGANDDTAALQLAIDTGYAISTVSTLNQLGTTVKLPVGTCRVTGNGLHIRNTTHIKGNSKHAQRNQSTTLIYEGTGTALEIGNSATPDTIIADVVLEDLQIRQKVGVNAAKGIAAYSLGGGKFIDVLVGFGGADGQFASAWYFYKSTEILIDRPGANNCGIGFQSDGGSNSFDIRPENAIFISHANMFSGNTAFLVNSGANIVVTDSLIESFDTAVKLDATVGSSLNSLETGIRFMRNSVLFDRGIGADNKVLWVVSGARLLVARPLTFANNDIILPSGQSGANAFVFDLTGALANSAVFAHIRENYINGYASNLSTSNSAAVSAVFRDNVAIEPDGVTVNPNHTGSGTYGDFYLNTMGGGSANKGVCFKADGKTLGFCSTVLDSGGACTCS